VVSSTGVVSVCSVMGLLHFGLVALISSLSSGIAGNLIRD